MNPLTVLPLALASGGGHVGAFEAQQLVAAGLTLLQRSAPLVRALAGRRAAILLPTSHQFYVALAACEGRGAVLVNPLAAPPEVAYQLRDADVGAVFTVGALASPLPDGTPMVLLDDAPRSARVVIGGASRDVDLGAHFGLDLEAESDVEGSDEECAIVYTSAMSGTARGAILTHRNLLANARSTVAAADITADDHALAILPFSHLFGLVVSGVSPLLAGGRVTPVERFHPGKAIEALESSGITQFVAVPSVYATMVALLQRRGTRLQADRLSVCMCGGAPLSVAVQDAWADLTGVELRQGYGLTEAAPVCLFNRVALPNRRGTLGVPFPDVEVEIHDPAIGTALPAGTPGEICVRGANVFPGYVRGYRDGLQVRDGWLHTGDRGVATADGVVTFLGLIKPMFTRNGFNIYPREIERVVSEMPGVERVVVRAVPDEAKENAIALDVTGDVTESAVTQWCESRLSAYKQPSEVNVRRG